MMGLGTPELIIIFVVALIVFGPRKLPELGRSLGKGLAEFKKTSNELRNTLDDEIRAEERRTPTPAPYVAPVAPVASSELTDGHDGSDESIDGDQTTDTVARGEQSSTPRRSEPHEAA